MDLEHSVQCKNQRSNLSKHFRSVCLYEGRFTTIFYQYDIENVRENIARDEWTMNADYILLIYLKVTFCSSRDISTASGRESLAVWNERDAEH